MAAITTVGSGLSEEDVAKIRKVHQKYEEAWLRGDANAVLALFTEDCVLLPPPILLSQESERRSCAGPVNALIVQEPDNVSTWAVGDQSGPRRLAPH